uniref:HTH araC/xylS-type domain-containing protein n=1 Tax=Paenibacillus athensensis TaxID=1967502 RepID=A0A4Y8PUC8_9BACL
MPASASELAGRLAASIEALVLHAGEADADAAKRGIEQLAQRLGYTAAHCSRVFQSAYGMSPRQYLSMVKLRQAKLLLMDSELSVEQVAVRLGYHDVSQFSKQFKRWTNLSPSAYRQLSF